MFPSSSTKGLITSFIMFITIPNATIMEKLVNTQAAMDFFNSPVKNPVGKSIINKMIEEKLKTLSDVFSKSELDSIYTLWK
mgnify:CR=1 FL=1